MKEKTKREIETWMSSHKVEMALLNNPITGAKLLTVRKLTGIQGLEK